MMSQISRNVTLLVVLVIGCMTSTARAGFSGSIGLAGFGPAINAPGLSAASTFTIPSFLASARGLGSFATVPQFAAFDGGTFSLQSATGFRISSAAYGTFTETVAPMLFGDTIVDGVLVAESFYIVGTYVGGPAGTYVLPATFTVSFTQDGGRSSSLSASGTLTIPAPGPDSAAMLGVGLVAVGGFGLGRRGPWRVAALVS